MKIHNGSNVTRAFPIHGGFVQLKSGETDDVELRVGWLTEERFRGLVAVGVEIEIPDGHDLTEFCEAELEAMDKAAEEHANAMAQRKDAHEARQAEITAAAANVEGSAQVVENTTTSNSEPVPIEDLKARADELEIEYAPNIGAETLAARIAEAEAA